MRRALRFLFIFCVVVGASFGLRKFLRPSRPNLILILIDTLRADHLGAFGFKRATSPNLDRFAAENLKFTRAISSSNWTPSAVASLFTGLYPSTHGYNPPKVISAARKTKSGLFLSSKFLTIPQLLKSTGYVTGAVSANPWIGPGLGFGEGFDHFVSLSRSDADQVILNAEHLLNLFEDNSAHPFFLYLHFMDPHNPYVPHPESEHLFTHDISSFFDFHYSQHANSRIRLYDGEILNVDLNLGKFIRLLKQRGLYESTKIIIIADHGEQFHEHGKGGHGRYLFNEEIKVPLIIKDTGQAQVINDVASNIDIFPTIFHMIGLPPPKEFPGISLLDAAANRSRLGVFSETYRDYPQQAYTSNNADKIIYDVKFDSSGVIHRSLRGMYNFFEDRLEQKPISNTLLEAELLAKLDSEYKHALELKALKGDYILKQYSSSIVKDPQDGVDQDMPTETIKQLKSLGYIGN